MSDTKTKFPRYFVVNFDVFVKIEKAGDTITGINHLGNPYPPKVALVEGQEITEKEFKKAVEASKKKRSEA